MSGHVWVVAVSTYLADGTLFLTEIVGVGETLGAACLIANRNMFRVARRAVETSMTLEGLSSKGKTLLASAVNMLGQISETTERTYQWFLNDYAIEIKRLELEALEVFAA